MAIELALATDCEWTYIAGKNCTQESGCSHGVYDHHMTSSEKVNWTLMYSTISDQYSFTGYHVDDTLCMRNGVTQIDTDYPFFMIDNAMDL